MLAITGGHDMQVPPEDVAAIGHLVQGPFDGHVARRPQPPAPPGSGREGPGRLPPRRAPASERRGARTHHQVGGWHTCRMTRRAAKGEGGAEPTAMLRSQHAEATRRAVLDAARTLFGRQGYAQTSVEEIADAARVTKGAVYHHFAGKEALFRAVYAEVEADAQARALRAGTRAGAGRPDRGDDERVPGRRARPGDPADHADRRAGHRRLRARRGRRAAARLRGPARVPRHGDGQRPDHRARPGHAGGPRRRPGLDGRPDHRARRRPRPDQGGARAGGRRDAPRPGPGRGQRRPRGAPARPRAACQSARPRHRGLPFLAYQEYVLYPWNPECWTPGSAPWPGSPPAMAPHSSSSPARSRNHGLWRDVIARLADRYRCVTVDLPLGSHPGRWPRERTARPPPSPGCCPTASTCSTVDDATVVANDTAGGLLLLSLASRAPGPRADRAPRPDQLRELRPVPAGRAQAGVGGLPGRSPGSPGRCSGCSCGCSRAGRPSSAGSPPA